MATPSDTSSTKDSATQHVDSDSRGPVMLMENLTSTLTTMNAVILAVHSNTESSLLARDQEGMEGEETVTESVRFVSLRTTEGKPCFALRVLVQERLAAIIAQHIAGGPHAVDVDDSFIVVRIGGWKEVVNMWMIPSGAWRAFRTAALESIMLVGERSLIQQGAESLYSLSPDEFHSVFSPVVAAMGDSETLEGWLKGTAELAKNHFEQAEASSDKKHRKVEILEKTVQMPKSFATAFSKN